MKMSLENKAAMMSQLTDEYINAMVGIGGMDNKAVVTVVYAVEHGQGIDVASNMSTRGQVLILNDVVSSLSEGDHEDG